MAASMAGQVGREGEDGCWQEGSGGYREGQVGEDGLGRLPMAPIVPETDSTSPSRQAMR